MAGGGDRFVEAGQSAQGDDSVAALDASALAADLRQLPRIPAPPTLDFAVVLAEIDSAALDARLERAAARLGPVLARLDRRRAPVTLSAPAEFVRPRSVSAHPGARPRLRLLPRLAAAAAVVCGVAVAWWSAGRQAPRTGRFAAETAALSDRAIVPVRVVVLVAATTTPRPERDGRPARGGP